MWSHEGYEIDPVGVSGKNAARHLTEGVALPSSLVTTILPPVCSPWRSSRSTDFTEALDLDRFPMPSLKGVPVNTVFSDPCPPV